MLSVLRKGQSVGLSWGCWWYLRIMASRYGVPSLNHVVPLNISESHIPLNCCCYHSPSDFSINRIPHSSLHPRDPRASSSLFDSYGGERSRPPSKSPGGYGGYQGVGNDGHMNGGVGPGAGAGAGGYRSATPNTKYVMFPPLTANWTLCLDGHPEAYLATGSLLKRVWCDARGHYSDAVLSSLESQNDTEIEGITAKVKMLKDVRLCSRLPCIRWFFYPVLFTDPLSKDHSRYRFGNSAEFCSCRGLE